VNINEENVLAIGQCFPFAVQMAKKWWNDHIDKTKRPGKGVHPDIDNKDKFKVVHGTITNKWDKSAKPVIHAWVEMGDKVFDDQTSATKPNGIDKAIYYDNFQPEPKHEYTAEEVVINCMVKGGPGPWDEEFIEKIKARDAWLGETRMDIEQIIKEELTKYLKEELQSVLEAGPLSDQERHYQRANAHAANEIEDFISNRLIKLAGPVEQWTDEHLETFEQINNLLNVLFPSGD
jgi:hypothetical protein